MAGQGYSWFHGTARTTETFGGRELTSSFDGQRLLGYLSQLEADGYPYDMVQLRYSIDTDNGPPDPGLPDLVRAWNEKYASPRLVLTTTHAMFRELEQRYADSIPTVSGDFTPYWKTGRLRRRTRPPSIARPPNGWFRRRRSGHCSGRRSSLPTSLTPPGEKWCF